MRTNWRHCACHIDTNNNTTADAPTTISTSLAPHSITSVKWIFIFGRHSDVGEFNATSFYLRDERRCRSRWWYALYSIHSILRQWMCKHLPNRRCFAATASDNSTNNNQRPTRRVLRNIELKTKRCQWKEPNVKCIHGVWRHHSRVHRVFLCLLVIIVRTAYPFYGKHTVHMFGAQAKRKNSASFRCDVYFLTFQIIFLLPPSFDIRYDTCTAHTQSIPCLWDRERLTCRNSVRFSFWTNKHTINERQPSSYSYCIRKINDRKCEQQTIDTKRKQLPCEISGIAELSVLVHEHARASIKSTDGSGGGDGPSGDDGGRWWCATKKKVMTTIIARLQFLLNICIPDSSISSKNNYNDHNKRHEVAGADECLFSCMCTIQFYICCRRCSCCSESIEAYFIIACPRPWQQNLKKKGEIKWKKILEN